MLAAAPAGADNWLFTPRITANETYTTNANLAPEPSADSSFVTVITPGIAFTGDGARLKLRGDISAEALVYTSDTVDDTLFPRANVVGTLEAIERFFFLEGEAIVSQRYISPFAPQPEGSIGETANRFTSSSFRASPYIQGRTGGNVSYLLRSDFTWFDYSDVSPGVAVADMSYSNRTVARLAGPAGQQFDWGLDAQSDYTKFPDQRRSFDNELARATLGYWPDPLLRVFASGGYERAQYSTTDTEGAIYGAGFAWRPTDRTNIRGQWEERFFGGSYLAAIDHRNPYTAFNFTASRNASTYPTEILSLPAGGNVPALVNAILTTRIPDPNERLAAVATFMRQTGLPTTLQTPVVFYTEQLTLVEQASATGTYIGVRNTLALTLFYSKTEVITDDAGLAIASVLGTFRDNRQRGGSVTLSHRLTPLTSLTGVATYTQAKALQPPQDTSTTKILRLASTTSLGPKTEGLLGASYTDFYSTLGAEYDAFTVFVGLTHRF